MQISDIFYHNKKHGYINYIILKYFYRKPEEILSFLMILDENLNFPPKFVKNLHKLFKILINYKKKIKVQKKILFYIFILLDLFYDCANFQVNRSISCWDLRGGQNSPPPPPQWTQVLKITQWD